MQSKADIIRYSKHMKAIHARAWGKFILNYVENLNLYKTKGPKAKEISLEDHVLYSGLNKEMAPVNTYQVCKVKEIIHGRDADNQPRSLKVELLKGGKPKIFTRNLRRFALLEVDDLKTDENTESDAVEEPINHKQDT